MSSRRPPVAAGVALLLLVTAWVTTADRVSIVTGGSRSDTSGGTQPNGGPLSGEEGPLTRGPAPTALVETVMDVAVTVGGAVFVGFLLYYLWGIRMERRARLRRQAEARFEALPAGDADQTPDIDASGLSAATEAHLVALSEGAPRNAIIKCWLALEEATSQVGLPRDPAETSLEFTTRVVSTYAVHSSAIHQLASLYREARFSRHRLGERERAVAITALTQLDADLRRPPAEATSVPGQA